MRNGLIIDTNGTKCWYRHGKFHRTDGPAVERANGDKFWYRHGKLHRKDGPAIEYANGDKFWYINDRTFTTIWTCKFKYVQYNY